MAKKPTTRNTSLDFAILGILIQNPMSGYGIRMMFEKTALASFSSSPGSIYPALQRLEKQGLVEKKFLEKQHTFTVTKKGTSALCDWVTQPVTREDVIKDMDMLLLRFAFMDTLPRKISKRKFLKSLEQLIIDYVKELEDFLAREGKNLPLTGRHAFEHGIESYNTTLKWIERIISSH